MSELCRTTATAVNVAFRSERAAERFMEKLNVGTAGQVHLVEHDTEYRVKGTVMCLGYLEHKSIPGSDPAIPKEELCLVRRLQKLRRLNNFQVEGDCVIENVPA